MNESPYKKKKKKKKKKTTTYQAGVNESPYKKKKKMSNPYLGHPKRGVLEVSIFCR